MATYLIMLLGKFFPAMLMVGPDHIWLVAFIVCGFTFVVPSINLLLFRYLGSIQSLTLNQGKSGSCPSFLYH